MLKKGGLEVHKHKAFSVSLMKLAASLVSNCDQKNATNSRNVLFLEIKNKSFGRVELRRSGVTKAWTLLPPILISKANCAGPNLSNS